MSLDLLAFQTGVGAWLNDAREFLARVRFAHPDRLWLSVVPLALTLLAWLPRRRQQRRLAALGRLGAVAALQTMPYRAHRLTAFALVLVWLLLALSVARPRWGQGEERGIAVGRDLVVVLDFSRSMWAEDVRGGMARWQAAVAGTRELVDALRNRGGHRVAVVVFAARPKLLVPLTTDFDHLDFKLGELDATVPPAETRPADDDAVSGTRIGAALEAAVAAHDPRFPGFQDILLVTDGDDPAEDREWRIGITVSRAANVPVHVVGVGDPARESLIIRDGEQLEVLGKDGVRVPIQTRLHEEVAKTIADESLGAYLPARDEELRLDEFHRAKIESNATRDVGDERLPQPKERYAWFLAPAGLLLLFVWWRER